MSGLFIDIILITYPTIVWWFLQLLPVHLRRFYYALQEDNQVF